MLSRLISWVTNILSEIGWYGKKGKIIFLGLDNAGKTTLLKKLKDDKIGQFPPTLHPHAEELHVGDIVVTAWDLGGHEAARKTWRNYMAKIDCIVYLVDASQQERFEQARIELENILEMESLQKVPIVVLGNKIDRKQAVQEGKLRQRMGLKTQFQKDERPVEIFMCSVYKGIGYMSAFKWISKYLK